MRVRIATRPWLLVQVTVLALTSPFTSAAGQTLTDVTWTGAGASLLDPALRLPSGSLRAVGPGVAALADRLPGAAAWSEVEAYAAPGLAAARRPAFLQRLGHSFAAAGYFETSRSTTPDGAGSRTRSVYEDATGRRALLVVFDAPDELVWLFALPR